jgi:AcrR family transcriptional regulator
MPKATAKKTAGPDIALDAKLQPTQARGQDTYEIVLATAGEMLRETGFEQLTTNAICKRAGLTPPALYRYFPNKYAILKELGDRLMKAQDDMVFAWIEAAAWRATPAAERIEKNVVMMTEMIEMTRRFPGGAAIGRALRAVPMLQQLRFASRDMVAGSSPRFSRRAIPGFLSPGAGRHADDGRADLFGHRDGRRGARPGRGGPEPRGLPAVRALFRHLRRSVAGSVERRVARTVVFTIIPASRTGRCG